MPRGEGAFLTRRIKRYISAWIFCTGSYFLLCLGMSLLVLKEEMPDMLESYGAVLALAMASVLNGLLHRGEGREHRAVPLMLTSVMLWLPAVAVSLALNGDAGAVWIALSLSVCVGLSMLVSMVKSKNSKVHKTRRKRR